MSDIAPVSLGTTRLDPAFARTESSCSDQSREAPSRRGEDSAEISFAATYLAKLRDLPAIRQDLVDTVRAQIAGGAYDTPEKLDAAIEEMMNDL